MANVIKFPGQESAEHQEVNQENGLRVSRRAERDGLFIDKKNFRGFAVFLSMDSVNEDALLRFLAITQCNLVVDIRQIPIFSPPNFDMDTILNAFRKFRIKHFHFSPILKMKIDHVPLEGNELLGVDAKNKLSEASNLITLGLFEGLVVVIFDRKIDEKSITDARAFISRNPEFSAEVSESHIWRMLATSPTT